MDWALSRRGLLEGVAAAGAVLAADAFAGPVERVRAAQHPGWVFGRMTGAEALAEALALDPHLPPKWRSLGFHVHWRGRLVAVRIDADAGQVEATLTTGDPMPIRIGGRQHRLERGTTLRAACPAMGGGRG